MDALSRSIDQSQRADLSDWLTVKEAAKHLRLTPDTIRRKVRASQFDTRREGKLILIARDCLLG